MASDPIFATSPNFKGTVSSSSSTATLNLLQKAFPSTTIVQQIYKQKLEHRPLNLNPTGAVDARESRRQKRSEKLKRKRKPKPLSAKEKRELRIHDLSKEDIKYDKFLPLNRLWNGYISEIIPSASQEPNTASHGPTLLKADYHGAMMSVEDCRCASRIGISGICVKETKNTFEIVTADNRLLRIPKERSLFRATANLNNADTERIEWRLWGDQFLVRSGERAGKRFNGRTIRGKSLLEL